MRRVLFRLISKGFDFYLWRVFAALVVVFLGLAFYAYRTLGFEWPAQGALLLAGAAFFMALGVRVKG